MAGSSRTRRFRVAWAAVWTAALGLQLGLGLLHDGRFVAPHLIFWIVVIGAGGCAVVSLLVVRRAFRENVAETALLGSFLTGVSVLPLAHGLLIPGVLYGENEGVVLAVQLAIPVAAIALVPLLRLDRPISDWRRFVAGHLGFTTAVAALLLLEPHTIPAAVTGSPAAIVFALSGAGICLALSLRQLRLAVISQQWPSWVVAASLALVGSAPMIFVAGDVFGTAFWSAHVLDITGVFGAGFTALFAHRRGATAQAILAPLEAATPLRSFEIGLDPLVHRFVADLDGKDEITRDHVVRTGRLAILVAQELRLAPDEVRSVGLGAILHDVGKLEVPTEILTKPDRLTDEEFDVMKTHAAVGAAMVEASIPLRNAAPYVRGHHERIDGRGYPDQLRGEEIPLGARIVAACDGWDAMTHSRQYREGMSEDRVVAIMREHQGAQWDAVVVDALLRVVERDDGTDPVELSTVGRVAVTANDSELACCREAVPG